MSAARASTAVTSQSRETCAYDFWCERAYHGVRRALVPSLQNSHYAYSGALRAALAARGRWLDLGCGHDFLPSWMRTRVVLPLDRWETVGIDRDRAALSRHGHLLRRLQGDIERLPFRDGSFDVITANMVVEHVEHPRRMFAEVHRVLRENGLFLVHTPNVCGYSTALTRLLPKGLLAPLAKWLLHRDPDDVYPTFYRANSKRALEALASTTDLTTERLDFVHSSPQLIRFPPAMMLEMLAMSAIDRVGRESSRSCIVAAFRKTRAECQTARCAP